MFLAVSAQRIRFSAKQLDCVVRLDLPDGVRPNFAHWVKNVSVKGSACVPHQHYMPLVLTCQYSLGDHNSIIDE